MTSPQVAALGPVAPPLDLGGRTALVTGAAGGIGRACAVRLAAAGAKVRAVDRDEAGLERLTESAVGLPGSVEPYALDLTDLDAAEQAAAGTDVLVNNAGLQRVAPLEDFPPDVFHTVLTVMLEAPFRLIRGALPHMYGQGWGRIVNVSSVHGLRASAYKSAYVAAKHGLEGLSKTAALEGAPHGVTSNCVNPAYVRTPSSNGSSPTRRGRTASPRNASWPRSFCATAPSNGSSNRRRSPRPSPTCAVPGPPSSREPHWPWTAAGRRTERSGRPRGGVFHRADGPAG